jgi:hypothetical protein
MVGLINYCLCGLFVCYQLLPLKSTVQIIGVSTLTTHLFYNPKTIKQKS